MGAGVQVVLNGSGSSDPDGKQLAYAWSLTSKPAGSSVSIVNAISVYASLTPDVAGSYTVQLVVNDGKVASAADTMVVTAATGNRAPVATNAGADQSVVTGVQVTLNGNGSNDPDGNSLTYVWSLVSKPAGSAAAVSNATSSTAYVTPDVAGSYTVQLVVNDGKVDSAADTMMVMAATGNRSPVANAGADQSVAAGVQVTLNGSGSSDPDGNSLSYA